MPERLLCPIKLDGATIEVLSPRVGTVKLQRKIGPFISEGTEIGELVSLGRYFTLVVPKSGKVSSFASGAFNVGYGDKIISLEVASTLTQEAVQEEAIATIDATMDGLLYLSPSPKSPPFVEIGDEIRPGQTIGLIEVMKCFYPMKYQGNQPTKILGILIDSASPVTCGTKVYKVA